MKVHIQAKHDQIRACKSGAENAGVDAGSRPQEPEKGEQAQQESPTPCRGYSQAILPAQNPQPNGQASQASQQGSIHGDQIARTHQQAAQEAEGDSDGQIQAPAIDSITRCRLEICQHHPGDQAKRDKPDDEASKHSCGVDEPAQPEPHPEEQEHNAGKYPLNRQFVPVIDSNGSVVQSTSKKQFDDKKIIGEKDRAGNI
ncbi:hypothetical protein [Absidia glauca]|uniref:Uncharacterized protein n=1 Tax=Absidia glauca TaxID=4829 RepID=A0A168QC83_ABSGL|nr:hypothetical protein [Absidia glauca]